MVSWMMSSPYKSFMHPNRTIHLQQKLYTCTKYPTKIVIFLSLDCLEAQSWLLANKTHNYLYQYL